MAIEIIRDLSALQRYPRPVVTLGKFDGVHLGHRAILQTAIERARAAGTSPLALTFEPLPATLLSPKRAPRRIVAPADKLKLLEAAGLDAVIVIEFTREFSLLTPEQFASAYLRDKIGVREIVVGHSMSFGHNRAGNAQTMVELGKQFGFGVTVVGPVKIGAIVVSSSKVREAIAGGDLKTAARLLGRYHFLAGQVVRGRERGHEIGFPTVNLESETECLPPDGVYATRAILDGEARPSVTNIGMRPTFAEKERSIETHIFDFGGELYGRRIKVELIERIRGERKFDSAETLARQIALDITRAKEIPATI